MESAGSGCTADEGKRFNEESIGRKTAKSLKMDFFSRDNPWPKCFNLNKKFSVVESSINTETMGLSLLEESSACFSIINCEESEKHHKESTKSFESNSVKITSGNGEKSSIKVSTKMTKMVSNSPEECVANSSVIDSKENGKRNEESTKSFEPDHKDDKKSSDKQLPADSSAITSKQYDPHQASEREADQAFGIVNSLQESLDKLRKLRGYMMDKRAIRDSIKFFLANGYFEESFIETYKHVYEMFVKFFNTNLKHLTPIHHEIGIFDKDESKNVITNSLFKDDDGRIFMYLWTTTGSDIGREDKNEKHSDFHFKVNVLRHILEKPKNGYNMKISGSFVVRLNPYINEAQIVKFDRIDNHEILQQMIRDCLGIKC